MKKVLSILKPYVQNAIIDNQIREKISYLSIPQNLDLKALKSDVKMGAVQFSELDKLVVKENEPKYILITANNLEQGYLAVTYLAACFNGKHLMNVSSELEEYTEENETHIEEWKESSFRIPLIQYNDLQRDINGSNSHDIFTTDNFFMLGNQKPVSHTPYWMNCRKEAVCVVVEDMGEYWRFNGNMDGLEPGLDYFHGNDKVYVLHIEPWHFIDTRLIPQESDDYTNEDDEEKLLMRNGTWNHLVLSFSADEVYVYLKEETVKKYYKLLLRGNFAAKGITTRKGFSYERLVNVIIAMQDMDKCKLVENIIKYAIKDWKSADERPLENRDFDFMDRFCRAYRTKDNRKAKRQRTAKERMMQELIGMEDVKRQVLNVVNVMKYNRVRERMGIPGGSYHNVHVMLGAPGTAKTTMAKLMGQILVEEHLLPDNRFVCVNGAELKGKYVGHTAPKTKALFEENDIIVIDEAYSLVGDHGDQDSFSKEALAQLIIELESHSTDKLVIFAGYGGKRVNEKNNKMKDFLDANPGIKSRITSTIYFDSYSPEEMVQIFFKIAENNHYHPDESIREMLCSFFKKRVLDDNFGNGREARSLLETTVIYTANRILEQDKKIYTKTEMQSIKYEDVEKAIKQLEYAESVQNAWKTSKAIGFIR